MKSLTSHELLTQIFDHKRKEIAPKLRVSIQTLSRWTINTDNPLERIGLIVRHLDGNKVMDWLDSYRVPLDNNADNALTPRLSEESSKLIQDYAKMITILSETAKDGKITLEETAKIRTAWQRIQERTSVYVQECERGNFGS